MLRSTYTNGRKALGEASGGGLADGLSSSAAVSKPPRHKRVVQKRITNKRFGVQR